MSNQWSLFLNSEFNFTFIKLFCIHNIWSLWNVIHPQQMHSLKYLNRFLSRISRDSQTIRRFPFQTLVYLRNENCQSDNSSLGILSLGPILVSSLFQALDFYIRFDMIFWYIKIRFSDDCDLPSTSEIHPHLDHCFTNFFIIFRWQNKWEKFFSHWHYIQSVISVRNTYEIENCLIYFNLSLFYSYRNNCPDHRILLKKWLVSYE